MRTRDAFAPFWCWGCWWNLPAPKVHKRFRSITQPADAAVPAGAWQSSPSHLQAPCIALSCPPALLLPSCPCLLQTSLLPFPSPHLHRSLTLFTPFSHVSHQPFAPRSPLFPPGATFPRSPPFHTSHLLYPHPAASLSPTSPPRPSALQLIAGLRSPRTPRPFGSPPRTFVLRSPPCPLAPVPPVTQRLGRGRPLLSLPSSLLGAPPRPPRSAQAGPGGAICRGGDEEGPAPPRPARAEAPAAAGSGVAMATGGAARCRR